jgi:hypothetical protein
MPLASQGILHGRHRRFLDCEATLIEQIAMGMTFGRMTCAPALSDRPASDKWGCAHRHPV